MTQYTTVLDRIERSAKPREQLALTKHGLEIPDRFVGVQSSITVVTPTAARTVVPVGSGWPGTAHLLWRYPSQPEDLTREDLADGELLLGTLSGPVYRYTVHDDRPDTALDVALHSPRPSLPDDPGYDQVLRILILRVQAVKATLQQAEWVADETCHALQTACETIHRLCVQQQLVIPGTPVAIQDCDLHWNEQLSRLGTIRDHLEALEQTHYALSKCLSNDPFEQSHITETLADLYERSRNRCILARNRWVKATRSGQDTVDDDGTQDSEAEYIFESEIVGRPLSHRQDGDRDE